MNHTDVSLDLETLGTRPGSAVIQIGLSFFTAGAVEGPWVGDTHLIRIDPGSCVEAGLTVDWSTVAWWMHQSEDARASVTARHEGQSIWAALRMASLLVRQHGVRRVWGNGSGFDCVLLEEAYHRCGIPVPWRYSAQRDVRTLVELCPGVDRPVPEVPHRADCDALAQATWINNCWRSLNDRQHKGDGGLGKEHPGAPGDGDVPTLPAGDGGGAEAPPGLPPGA